MAYHTIGTIRRRSYDVSNHSSATAAGFAVSQRGKLIECFQCVRVNQTATAGSWTASLNGTQVSGLSSVAVTTSAVGESSGVSTGTVTAETFVKRGDVVTVVGSSLVASNWTFVIEEF